MKMSRSWSVFTKPWKDKKPEELGKFVSRMGFNAIEFPLRKGYQVEPDDAETGLVQLQNLLEKYGVRITSVASDTRESIFAACQKANVRLLRIMVFADKKIGYLKSISNTQKYLEGLVPLCERYNVTVGVQHHYGYGVSSTMELCHLLQPFNPKHIGAIWDAAHSALSGEVPAQALDIIWDKLCLVNLKAAFYKRVNGPESKHAVFTPYFTTGNNCAFSWRDTIEYLVSRGYDKDICMPAEYTDEENVEQYIMQDLLYAKSLFKE